MEPYVIVLILSYNGKHLLKEAIDSYLANDYPNYEVVVIDNGSTDGTEEWVKKEYPEVEVLRTEKNLGYAGGFNYGMSYAFFSKKANFVLISNNDVKADSKVLSELLKIGTSNYYNGFVTGKVYYYDNPDIIQTIGFIKDDFKWVNGHLGRKQKDEGQFDKIEERYFSDDVFILVKKKLFEQTKGYDEELKFQGEQLDWQARAKKLGFKIMYTPHAKIWHKDSMTIGKVSPFKQYFDTRNKLIIRLKNRDEYYNKKYYKWYLKNVVLKPFIKKTLKFKWKYSWAILTGYISAIRWGKKNNVLYKIK